MNLKDIIENCLSYLDGEVDVLGSFAENSDKVKLLVRCGNIKIKEIACDYLPLADECELEVEDGEIKLNAFPKRVKEVLDITKNGQKLPYKVSPSAIFVNTSGMVKVKYNYLPVDVKLDGYVEVDSRVSDVALIYGILSEYCMVTGRYEEGVYWGQKFENCMQTACRSNRERYVKSRSWR